MWQSLSDLISNMTMSQGQDFKMAAILTVSEMDEFSDCLRIF